MTNTKPGQRMTEYDKVIEDLILKGSVTRLTDGDDRATGSYSENKDGAVMSVAAFSNGLHGFYIDGSLVMVYDANTGTGRMVGEDVDLVVDYGEVDRFFDKSPLGLRRYIEQVAIQAYRTTGRTQFDLGRNVMLSGVRNGGHDLVWRLRGSGMQLGKDYGQYYKGTLNLAAEPDWRNIRYPGVTSEKIPGIDTFYFNAEIAKTARERDSA